MRDVNNNEDILDTRDVLERLEELESERADLVDAVAVEEVTVCHIHPHAEDVGCHCSTCRPLERPCGCAGCELREWDEEYGDELRALESFWSEIENSIGDYQHGETLIRESYFEDYARELAEDSGVMDNASNWPFTCIDWERAARELRMDYSAVDFDGVIYYGRS